MNPLDLAGLAIGGARAVLDRMFPDPMQRAAAELELRKLEADGSFEQRAQQAIALAQVDVNKIDASSDSPLQRNWRPGVGWVCVGALAWDTIARPMLTFGLASTGHPLPELPALATEQILGLLFALLGLGAYRTHEKVKGVA